MDQITFDLIVTKFRQLCSTKYTWIKTVSKNPNQKWGLIYETEFGTFNGCVKKEGGDLIFQIGSQEIIIWEKTFLGKSH